MLDHILMAFAIILILGSYLLGIILGLIAYQHYRKVHQPKNWHQKWKYVSDQKAAKRIPNKKPLTRIK